VIDIVDDGSGSCSYNMASKPDDKSSDFTVVTDCGRWKVGEGFFTPQN
jgi:hypothetical protein